MENTGKLRPLSATKAKSGSGDIPPPYLKWMLEVGGGQPHAPAALVPRRDPVPVGGGWVRARAGLDGYRRREKFCSHRKSNPALYRL